MKTFLAVIVTLTLLGADALGQSNCPDGGCPVPQFSAPPAVSVSFGSTVEFWKREGDKPGLWRLFVENTEVGSFDADDLTFIAGDKTFRLAPVPTPGVMPKAAVGAVVPKPKPAACQCDPCECDGCDCRPAIGQAAAAVPPGGVDADKVAPGGRGGFSVNGRRVDREAAFEALAANGNMIRDDSNALRLTVIGTEADRKKVREDIKTHAAMAEFAGTLLVTDFAPDAWQVAGLGYKNDGKPTVYVQAPGGKVLHRQDDYDGPEKLAGAVRKAKLYDPSKDQDLRKDPVKPDAPAPAAPGSINPQWVVLGAIALAYFLLGRGRA